MDTIQITFQTGQVLTASQLNSLVSKINELVGSANTGGGATVTVVNNLTSDSTTSALSAAQGKALNTALSGKGTYSKPSGGIPKTDLATAVQTSLTKADNAATKISTSSIMAMPTNGFAPNVYYIFSASVTGSVTWKLEASGSVNTMDEYLIQFSTGSTAPTITWNISGLKWAGGSAPTINANKTYVVSIINNLAVVGEF